MTHEYNEKIWPSSFAFFVRFLLLIPFPNAWQRRGLPHSTREKGAALNFLRILSFTLTYGNRDWTKGSFAVRDIALRIRTEF